MSDSQKSLINDHAGAEFLIDLRFLCYLLFKVLLFFVSPRRRYALVLR